MRLCLFSGACVKYFRSMSLHVHTHNRHRARTHLVHHIRRANTPGTGHTSLHRTVVRYFHNRFHAGAFIAGNFAACWGVKWRSAIEYASTIRSLRSIVTRFYLWSASTIEEGKRDILDAALKFICDVEETSVLFSSVCFSLGLVSTRSISI